ncbi:hypothetical protein CPB83DRAFT_371857 [Crepidotus variabilis]|uniref:F-box domain-containing protein n=1 Tax=Crepidotus variabilis TaxID=179855 RepID=A0A9P6JNZ2_9AGAR|nr:hypothetical protein CPB83DRAFT_371857 [Crepidotus variabilis]
MASDLPQELYARIYALLHPRPDLLSCGLVCRAWFLCTRQSPLFRDVTINNLNADGFADLVMNPYSSFPFCIKQLTLNVDAIWFRRLLPFLQPLNATSLRLCNLQWTALEAHTQSKFIATFSKTIQRLVLGPRMTFESFVEATNVISQFSDIVSLAMEDVQWKTPQSPTPSKILQGESDRRAFSMYSLPTSCHSVSFMRCELGEIVQWLYAHTSFPDIHKLSIGNIKFRDIIHLRGLCCAAGPTIQEIALSFDVGEEGLGELDSSSILVYEGKVKKEIPGLNDIRHQAFRFGGIDCTIRSMCVMKQEGKNGLLLSLTTLYYDNFIYFTDRGRSCGPFFGVKSLAFLAARGADTLLQKITFVIMLQKVGDLDYHTIDWIGLDAILVYLAKAARQSSSFPSDGSLDNDKPVGGYPIRIIFELGGSADLEAMAALIQQKLPQCHQIKALIFREKQR